MPSLKTPLPLFPRTWFCWLVFASEVSVVACESINALSWHIHPRAQQLRYTVLPVACVANHTTESSQSFEAKVVHGSVQDFCSKLGQFRHFGWESSTRTQI